MTGTIVPCRLDEIVTMGTMKPLSVGGHRVDAYWTTSGLHCDGFRDVIEFRCLSAGGVNPP